MAERGGRHVTAEIGFLPLPGRPSDVEGFCSDAGKGVEHRSGRFTVLIAVRLRVLPHRPPRVPVLCLDVATIEGGVVGCNRFLLWSDIVTFWGSWPGWLRKGWFIETHP